MTFHRFDGSLLLLLYIVVFEIGVVYSLPSSSSSSYSPVIGILALPRHTRIEEKESEIPSNNGTDGYCQCCQHDHDDLEFYIAASYAKWLEAGGARSVPIPFDSVDDDFLDDLFSQLNGILLPGGSTNMFPYSAAYLLNRSIEANEEGNFFPVWGTCLGFEYLVNHIGSNRAGYHHSWKEDEEVIQSGFDAENISLPLLSVRPQNLYRNPTIYQTVTQFNVTMNNHVKGIEPAYFMSNKYLFHSWEITSTNVDRQGRPFVSTIEPKDPDRFPFYGVQFHPEKNAFEYGTFSGTNIPYEVIDHSDEGIGMSLYMASFFVKLARTNQHKYSNPEKFPVLTHYPVGKANSPAFEQLFLLPKISQGSDTMGLQRSIGNMLSSH